MCDSLVTEILNYCKATCGLELGRASGPHDLLRAELSLLKCLVRLCRAAMVEWFKELGRDYRGATVQRNGVSYRFVGPPLQDPARTVRDGTLRTGLLRQR